MQKRLIKVWIVLQEFVSLQVEPSGIYYAKHNNLF